MAKPQEQQPGTQQTASRVKYHCEKCGHIQEGKTPQAGGKPPSCCGEEMTPTVRQDD